MLPSIVGAIGVNDSLQPTIMCHWEPACPLVPFMSREPFSFLCQHLALCSTPLFLLCCNSAHVAMYSLYSRLVLAIVMQGLTLHAWQYGLVLSCHTIEHNC